MNTTHRHEGGATEEKVKRNKSNQYIFYDVAHLIKKKKTPIGIKTMLKEE